MKTIYTAIMARLKSTVPALKWIDLDCGQLNQQNPALAYPCALIGIKLPNCKDITEKSQDCKASITVRLAFNTPTPHTNANSAPEKQQTSLAAYDTIADVYAALQGFETDNFNTLSRSSQGDEKRNDGIFVYQITFNTDFEDDTAE